MHKKILIITTSGGMGHIMAAKAIETALADKYPAVETRVVNIIDYTSKVYQKLFDFGYDFASTRVPLLWKFFYNFYKKKSRQKFLQMLSKTSLKPDFFSMIDDFSPDMIISTHPLPAKMISASGNKDLINIPSILALTDFGCHSVWVDDNTDYYTVATEAVKKILVSHGLNPNKVAVTGIPIHLKFAKNLDKNSIIKKIGLDPKLKTITIVGGQLKFKSLVEIINGIQDQLSNQVQFIIITGRDNELEAKIKKSNLNQNKAVKIFGFVDNMEEMMTVSDLIFSKAGGVTVSECLAKGLPMIINKVIPGQEEDNVNFLVSNGAALKAGSVNEIITDINNLLNNSEKIHQMQQAAQRIGRPNSSTSLADFVMEKMK